MTSYASPAYGFYRYLGLKKIDWDSKRPTSKTIGYGSEYENYEFGPIKVTQCRLTYKYPYYWFVAKHLEEGRGYGLKSRIVRRFVVCNRVSKCFITHPSEFSVTVKPIINGEFGPRQSVVLTHSDVLPSIDIGDAIDLEISFCAKSIQLFDTDPRLVKEEIDQKECIKFLKNDVLQGTILLSEQLLESQETEAITRLLIDSEFGLIELYIRNDLIDQCDRQMIKTGAFISASGWYFGDCAVNEYQNGALFDQLNLFKYVAFAIKHKQIERIGSVLSPECSVQLLNGGLFYGINQTFKILNNILTALPNQIPRSVWYRGSKLSFEGDILIHVYHVPFGPRIGVFPEGKSPKVITIQTDNGRVSKFVINNTYDVKVIGIARYFNFYRQAVESNYWGDQIKMRPEWEEYNWNGELFPLFK